MIPLRKSVCPAGMVLVALVCFANPTTLTAAVIQVPADYATIAAGVTAAAPYDTVQVAAGTYAENITINKALALFGPNTGISPNIGARVAEAIIAPATGNGITLTGTAGALSDVTISGFQLDQIPGQAVRAVSYDYFNIEISYNLFTNTGTYAIYSINGTPVTKDGATHNGTRQNWLIHENRFEDYTAATVYTCALVNCWNENLVATDNVFVDHSGLGNGRAFTFDGTSDATIAGNTFINQSKWGVYLLDGARTVEVADNTFEGGDRGVLLGASVDASDNPYTVDGVTIQGNSFSGHSNIGIDILRVTAISGAIGNIDIRQNDFAQDVGVLTASVPLIDVKLDSSIVAGPLSIAENTFTYSGSFGAGVVAVYGVRVRGGGVGQVDIDRNVMEGGGVGGAVSCGVQVRALYDVYGVLQPSAVIRIRENSIHGFTNAITSRSTVFGELPAGIQVTVTGNDLSGNDGAMANYAVPSELIDAAGNWWGAPDEGSVSAAAGGQVVYNAWLTSGTDTDPGTPGFQGDFSDLVVSAASPQSAGSTAIQQGVDLATGGTVHILPGSYEEQVEVAQSLTLSGQDATTTFIVSPPSLAASFLTGSNTNHAVVYAHDAADVVLEHLTIDGLGRGNANYRFVGAAFRNAGGRLDHCTITGIRNEPIDGSQHGVAVYALADDGTPRTLDLASCTVDDFQKNGVTLAGPDLAANVDQSTITGAGAVSFIAQNGIQLSGGATGSLTANTISGFSYEPATYVSCGMLIYGAGGVVSVTQNQVTESQVGIYLIDAQGAIAENTVANTPGGMGTTPFWWCIVADPGAGTVARPPADPVDPGAVPTRPAGPGAVAAALTTTVYRNEVDGGGNGTGIEADALGTETLNFTAAENIVTNCAAGFVLYREPGATLNASVMHNGISGNQFGLVNESAVPQEAGANWWGDATGPRVTSNPHGTADSVSVDADYSPWLSRADDDPLTPGFQAASPMHWYANATSTYPISRAVGLAGALDTISLLAGTYVDNAIIDKTLALLGQDADSVTIYPAFSDVGPPEPPSLQGSQLLVVRAHDVVIDRLTLDGDSPTLTAPGVVDARNGIVTDLNAMGTWNNLAVTNCVLRNFYWRGIFAVANLSSSGHVIRDNSVAHVTGAGASAGIMFAGATGEIVGNTVGDCTTGIAFAPGTTGSITGGRADSNVVSGGATGIAASYATAPVEMRGNTVGYCSPGAGLQLIWPKSTSLIAENEVSDCDTSLALHGGNTGQLQSIADNRLTGSNQFGSVGVFASTFVDADGTAPVYARLARNVITNHSYGIMLHEHAGSPDHLMNVTIGGTPGEADSLYANSLFELFLADCDDDVDALYNYWGTTDCDGIEARIWHQVDQAGLGLVDFGSALCSPACPVAITGDVNVDGFITAADIIYMVNFVFKGGAQPNPIAEAGDVNCDAQTTAADVIYLVNLVFKSGPGPCDVCTIL